jgi:putative DNA primase/helicase
MFDGLMIYGNYYEQPELLTQIEQHINHIFQGLEMKMSYKIQDTTSIIIPEDFTIEPKNIDNPLSFEKVNLNFEMNHCKIINRDIFIKHLDNDNIIMKRQGIKSAYEHMVYLKPDKNGDLVETNFINDWLINNPNIRRYDDIGVYPNASLCPESHFNMWRPFDMEYITSYSYDEVGLNYILKHIKVLCNNDEVVYDYFIKWIAQMIQYPEVKTNCPTFISKEGAGKGSLMRLFEKMLGSSKVFETTNPSRDIWGDFNGRMANTFLINLNELSKKETLEAEGKIKGLVTDPILTINNKGSNQFDIQSYHRFIISTNNEEPINTNKDDRRKFIIRCSDELIGNKEYFNTLYEHLNNVDCVKTCYEYFKSIADMDQFNKIPVPITEYHQNLMEFSMSPIEQWVRDYTFINQNRDFEELKSETILEKFNDWKENNGVKYECSSIQLAVRISRLKINGIEKSRSKESRKTRFTFELMKKHFGM